MEQKLGHMELRFAELIWEREPVASGELVRLCAEVFSWKKSTTYTMLKRLCERKIFVNEGGMVRALISREEYEAIRSERFVAEAFAGSLPRFLTAFTKRKQLSESEIAQLQELIDNHKEEQ